MKSWIGNAAIILIPSLLAVVVFSFIYPLIRPDVTADYTPPVMPEGPVTELQVLELVNEERAKVGLAPLKLHPGVTKSAQLKAEDMLNRGYRGHRLPEDPDATLTLEMYSHIKDVCSSSGENISYNVDIKDNTQATSAQVFDGWMNSPPHKAAILDPKYTLTGIGVVDGHIAVQRFCVAY